MDTADKQHQQTVQKVMHGPRPQPIGTPRAPNRAASEDDIDTPTKRSNVFKRALRGLSTKNTTELQNIESMLMRLLGEVEGLRANQDGPPSHGRGQSTNFHSGETVREATDPGYEPEGQAGTASTGDRSGFLSSNSSRQADYRGPLAGHRDITNRVSTVMEDDEDVHSLDSRNQARAGSRYVAGPDNIDRPEQGSPSNRGVRRSSGPLSTPLRGNSFDDHTYSNEATPQMSGDSKSKSKHKSTSSSLYPKMISRWSKTTASSIADNFRFSTQSRARPYSQVSRSGSDVNLNDYEYDPREHALAPDNSYLADHHTSQENRPPSPLVPSQVSEDPKYAHRNSMNLEHPQPRHANTGRFQNHLENEAQAYGGEPFSPSSQASSGWHQAGMQSQGNPRTSQRYSGYSGNERLSPISDDTYSETSSVMMENKQEGHGQGAPGRVSQTSMCSDSGRRSQLGRFRDEEPLVPQRPPKVPMSPGGGRSASYLDHVSAARAGSPAFDKVRVEYPIWSLTNPSFAIQAVGALYTS